MIYLPIYSSDASFPPGTPSRGWPWQKSSSSPSPALSPHFIQTSPPSPLMYSSTLSSHLTTGLPFTPDSLTSFIYTYFVKALSPILSRYQNHLSVLCFTLSIIPQSTPIATSSIPYLSYILSLLSLFHLVRPHAPLRQKLFLLHLF